MCSKDNLNVKATIKVSKYDNNTGELLCVEEKEVMLTPKEVEKLCHSQKQA